jgi:hypothetical protein
MHICILLADHYGINPNEFLMLAGWPALKAFDVRSVDTENLPPEAVDIALAVAKISDPGTRKAVVEAMLTLVKKYRILEALNRLSDRITRKYPRTWLSSFSPSNTVGRFSSTTIFFNIIAPTHFSNSKNIHLFIFI